jgi:hypothetical protein
VLPKHWGFGGREHRERRVGQTSVSFATKNVNLLGVLLDEVDGTSTAWGLTEPANEPNRRVLSIGNGKQRRPGIAGSSQDHRTLGHF